MEYDKVKKTHIIRNERLGRDDTVTNKLKRIENKRERKHDIFRIAFALKHAFALSALALIPPFFTLASSDTYVYYIFSFPHCHYFSARDLIDYIAIVKQQGNIHAYAHNSCYL